MATTDFGRWRDPVQSLGGISSMWAKRNMNSKELVEFHCRRTQEEQERWLEHVQHILRDTFPFLKDSRDLTGFPVPQNPENLLTRTCFYRGGVIPGVVYKFNFTQPFEGELWDYFKSQLPLDYRITNHLYVMTAGRFDLELFRHAEAPMYYI
jgi:hypothetical protein